MGDGLMAESTPAGRRGSSFKRVLRQIGPVRLLVTLLLLAGALYIARYSWNVPFVGDGERALYDLRFAQNAERTTEQDKDITLVTYSDDTLLRLKKRSPLDRATLAKALRAINAMNPKGVAIDILFDQPQDEDEELIAALREMRAPTYVAFVTTESNPDQMIYEQEQYLREFMARASTDKVKPASVQMDADVEDGVVRRWATRFPGLPPTLSNSLVPERTEMAEYTGAVDYRIPTSDEIPVFSEIPIDTFIDLGDLPPDILEQAVSDPLLRGQFENRYILIGGNIQDFDQKETPMTRQTGRPMIGLEVHAHMLRQLIDNRTREEAAPWLLWLVALLVVVAGAVTGIMELRSWLLIVALALQLALIGYTPFFLEGRDMGTLSIPAAGWGVGWLLAFIGMGLAARAVGSEQRKFAHSALGKYLPPDVANEIMKDPDRLKLTGEKKEIYALFTDLEGFTKLSHAIEPEQLSTLLNRYLDVLSDTVLEHGGTIDKFIGDAVVAFWGAPISRPDDAERALKAAVAMYEAGEAFRREADPNLPPIGVTRVGLHKGEAVVGNFGGDRRIQYTALGDGMNTAARLESANKALQTTILASDEAVRDAGAGVELLRPMGRVVLSGRATPVEVWEPLPKMPAELRAELRALWKRYDGGDMAALEELERIASEHKDDLALQNFVFRIREAGPGRAYVMTSK
jgi:adenylate cyclase